MTVSTVDYLKAQYAVSKALGERSLSSDAVLVIADPFFASLSLLMKSFVWPVLSTAGEVEIWLPTGQKAWQQQQLETALQGQVVITETAAGHAYEALNALSRKRFDATIFEGQPDKFSRAVFIRDAFIKVDPAERDHESRSQVTQFSGTIFYHFFGEIIPGNIAAAGATALGAAGGA